jgi:uncharacterized membrane protein YccC
MDAFRVVDEIVERVRLELLALGGLADRDAGLRANLSRLREYAARTLDGLAAALEAGVSPLATSAALEGYDAAAAALDQYDGSALDAHARRVLLLARTHAQALAGQLRAAVRNADFAGSGGELRLLEQDARLPRALRPRNPLAILRANLRLSSIACRHALRCGVCLAIAVAGERALHLSHGFWIPMTAAIVLKPDFAGTFSFGLLRVIGTLLGLALATALVRFAFGGDGERIVLLAVLCFGFRELTTVHYGLGVMLLTALIVVLLSFFGIAPEETMNARALSTGIGSALALFAYLAWPTWEHGRVRPALAAMLDAYRDYFLAVLEDRRRVRPELRARSRSARTNAQASLDRLRGEPRRDARLLALAEGILANSNRFIRAAMALEAARQGPVQLPARPAVAEFAARVDEALAQIAACVRNGQAPASQADLRARQRSLAAVIDAEAADADQRALAAAWIDASDRIVDTVNTLVHLLNRARA